MDERRFLTRFNLRLRSELQIRQGKEAVQEAFTRDVSSRGAFFLTRDPLPIDTNLSMILFLHSGKASTGKIKVAGKVVRTELAGMAVRFGPRYRLLPAG